MNCFFYIPEQIATSQKRNPIRFKIKHEATLNLKQQFIMISAIPTQVHSSTHWLGLDDSGFR